MNVTKFISDSVIIYINRKLSTIYKRKENFHCRFSIYKHFNHRQSDSVLNVSLLNQSILKLNKGRGHAISYLQMFC